MKLENAHIVILGAGKRIGLHLTQRFLEAGAKVTALHRSPSPEIEKLASQFPKRLVSLLFDLTHFSESPATAQKTTKEFGKISGIVTLASQFYSTPLQSVTPSQWDELFDTNVKGHFFLLQSMLPYLTPSSHILALVDIFARKPLRKYLPYASAKGALLTLTRNLAWELAPHTRVNSISPGPVLLPESFSAEQAKAHQGRTLLGRLGSPEDIWEAARFLFSNEYLTGVDLAVDGGSSLV